MINTYDEGLANPNIFKQLSVRDLLFVYYKCPQIDRLVNLYNHYNLIAFSLEGERILHQSGKSWKVTPQTSYFQRKSAYVQELPDAQSWNVLAFHIPDEFLIQFANEYMDSLPIENLPTLTSDMLIKIELNEVTKTYFYSLIPYFKQTIPPTEQLLELKFKELFLNILSNPLNKQLLAYILHLNDEIKPPIWQIMEKNYMYCLTLNEFARISSRSLSAFKRDFVKYYNTSPGKWLTNKRLNYAAKLLITTKQSISDIVFNSGFKNLSHFSRIFKEKFKVSPQQYRKYGLSS
ncbi:AraC family transcriptional regulator [Tamlana sedimentorum]|uniref:AraC family transcriptional regulator n=1 Tax=Neotamlana sedimentorum TaxID=1435349 RepID=A0A0D7W7J2_9FLAO|nr:helix-turn-helix transcriptional regulator [Tamlana sedimentorum]KJD34984.1 AraC family transcriptional regulator [Tamlana sedimentorum]